MAKDESCIILGDMNAAVNPNANKITPTAKKVLEWEATKKIIILNDKLMPTRVSDRK